MLVKGIRDSDQICLVYNSQAYFVFKVVQTKV